MARATAPLLVHRSLSLHGDAAVRRPVGIPGLLGPDRLLRLPLGRLRRRRPRRPAARGRPDVDVRHDRLPRGGNARQLEAPDVRGLSGSAHGGAARHGNSAASFRSGRGDGVTMAAESMAVAAATSIPRQRVQGAVWRDYWALTKPEVNLLIVITTAAAFSMARSRVAASLPL